MGGVTRDLRKRVINMERISNRRERKSQESSAQEFCDLLKQLGWKQAEAAHRLGVTSNYINMIVRGRSEPSYTLMALLRMMAHKEEGIDERVQRIIAALNTLKQEERDRAITGLDALLDAWAGSRQKRSKILQPKDDHHAETK